MKVLALIPARGGSKGIKRKNLVPILGKPLVAYSIEHGLACKEIDRVVVSTEDPEIQVVSRKYGAEVVDRPKELAEDHVLDLPVFEHALEWLKRKDGYVPDLIVQLRPTSPYRKPEWLIDCVRLLKEDSDADSVITLHEVKRHPYRMFELANHGRALPLMKERAKRPHIIDRHDLPKIYDYNCVIDVTRPRSIWEKRCPVGDEIIPYLIDSKYCVDIDYPSDLVEAERMIQEFSK